MDRKHLNATEGDAAQADFSDVDMMDRLETLDGSAYDALPFGLVAMAMDGTVVAYNSAESKLSGLTPSRVVGRHFFSAVAPCTNNYLVAHRFETEPSIDETIDYVFTLRMAPTPVRLRMLKRPGAARMYLLVQRR